MMISSQANSPRFGVGQPLNASTANPSAASAAASAFARHSPANRSLSAAAAAAALKARPITPTNVAEVQTRRTQRRSSSQSSSAGRSTPDTRTRPDHLRRQSSSGSMTERTFRSPSPSPNLLSQRSLSAGGIPRRPYFSDEPPPPVPAIPESVSMSVNMEAARKQGTKPKSLGIMTTPVRTASQKAKDNTGPWFGAARQGDLSNIRTSDAIMSATSPPRPNLVHDDSERPESELSINFSYPARIRLASPTPSAPRIAGFEGALPGSGSAQTSQRRRSTTMPPQRGNSVRSTQSSPRAQDDNMVYDPNSRRMVSKAESLALEYQIRAASEARPKQKKQTPTRAGSHLSKGTVARSHGTAVDGTAGDHQPLNNAQLAAAASLRKQERQSGSLESQDRYQQATLEVASRPLVSETETEIERQPLRYSEVSTSPATNAPEVLPPQRSTSVLGKETSGFEPEAEPRNFTTPPNMSHALDHVPVLQDYAHGNLLAPSQSDPNEDRTVESLGSPIELAAAPTQPRPEFRNTQVQHDPRTHSVSPGRNARFASVQDNLTVRHEPPSRSTSPRKSALKQQSPSRGASPTGGSDGSDAGLETQDTLTPTRNLTPTRKKSVRVSFDDENTGVVGEAAGGTRTDSPTPPSSQVSSKRPWYNIGLGKKKGAIPLEEDEIMQPRPVLPTFGSVRGRKSPPHSTQERALVRPSEAPHDTSDPPSPGLEKRRGNDIVGLSSDSALGGLLQEQGPRNEANISKFREPLPPVVTSIEGNGYPSDTETLDSEAALMADTPRLVSEESRASEASTLVAAQSKASDEPADIQSTLGQAAVDIEEPRAEPSTAVRDEQLGAVPAIALTLPTPLDSEKGENRSSYIHFPGEFPETETETETDLENVISPSDASAPRRVTFEPVVQKEDATSTPQTPSTVLATHLAASETTDDTDGNSVYSDAYEDLSEVEGDGFQSLDAVVDSPVKTPPQYVAEERPGSVTPTPTVRVSDHAAVALATEQHTGKPIDDWEAAKTYWRSLTADRRAQLEVEANEEAGAEGDLDTNAQEPKPRRKKSTEQRNAEKKALEQQRAVADPDRTYMIKPGTQADEYHPPIKNILRGQSVPASRTGDHNPHFKSTLRGQSLPRKDEAGARLRKSMRGVSARPAETGDSMPKTLRSGSTPAKLQRRPMSYQPSLGTTSVTGGSNKHLRSVSDGQGISNIQGPSLRRRGSDSSQSSFKRSRSTSQGVSLRKSMRVGSNPVAQPRIRPSSRFSVRSISPPASIGGRMRTTLREDSKPAQSRRRSSQDSGKGYLRFPGPFSQKAKEKKVSRFGDDSSGDEDGSYRFSSRFEDSSDEDVNPQPLPPVKTAKTLRSGKAAVQPPSPPLPEEEEEDEEGEVYEEASEGMSGALPNADPAAGDNIDEQSTPNRGFISSVRRLNERLGSAYPTHGPATNTAKKRVSFVQDNEEQQLGVVRTNSSRLHKRNASLPAESSNWPLTGDEAETASDGGRPDAVGSNVGVAKKKKKFGVLRKIFRLDT
ncbi:hypothetical protein VPNG_04557 [Cytospora leucostoma]|uniref:Uncharacterized protein n=1 Tax=Cytospora leucostoma TaxID=1230097 RepID=A0A423XCK2_9PEZI|nr:hypothetical protein VPNG_04557 [Cytospora leucostoma]